MNETLFCEECWCRDDNCACSTQKATFGEMTEGQELRVLKCVADQPVRSMKHFAFLCTLITKRIRDAERRVLVESKEEQYEVSPLGLSLAWYLITARCISFARLDTQLRNQGLVPDRGFHNLSAVETRVAWEMVDRFNKGVDDSGGKEFDFGDLLIIPRELRGITRESFRKGKIYVRTYESLAFLWSTVEHIKEKQFSRLVVIGPLRDDLEMNCNVASLISAATKVGAKEIRIIAPPVTRKYMEILGRLRWLAEEAERYGSTMGIVVKAFLPRDDNVSVKTSAGCLGCPAIMDKEVVLDEERTRRFFWRLRMEPPAEGTGLATFHPMNQPSLSRKRPFPDGEEDLAVLAKKRGY